MASIEQSLFHSLIVIGRLLMELPNRLLGRSRGSAFTAQISSRTAERGERFEADAGWQICGARRWRSARLSCRTIERFQLRDFGFRRVKLLLGGSDPRLMFGERENPWRLLPKSGSLILSPARSVRRCCRLRANFLKRRWQTRILSR